MRLSRVSCVSYAYRSISNRCTRSIVRWSSTHNSNGHTHGHGYTPKPPSAYREGSGKLVLPPSYDTGHNFGTFDPPLEAYIRESRLEEWKKDHEHLEHHREHNHEETPLRPIVDPDAQFPSYRKDYSKNPHAWKMQRRIFLGQTVDRPMDTLTNPPEEKAGDWDLDEDGDHKWESPEHRRLHYS